MSIGLCLPLWAFNSDESDKTARDDVQNVLVSPVDNRSPCQFINSTTLRRLIIEEQVKIGMKAEDVQKALGSLSTSPIIVQGALNEPTCMISKRPTITL